MAPSDYIYVTGIILMHKRGLNIFTYGSLMFDAVWARVIGVEYEKHNARIHGYRRQALKNFTYPALIAGAEEEFVDGVVYLNVSPGDVGTLDCFEGKYYQRIGLSCILKDGSPIEADTYIFRENYRQMLDEKPWDVKKFEDIGIRTFLSGYKGFSDTNT